jgi:hypothetical protein
MVRMYPACAKVMSSRVVVSASVASWIITSSPTSFEIGPELAKFALDKNFGMHIILSAVRNKTAGSPEAKPSQLSNRRYAGVGTEMGRHRFIIAKNQAKAENEK